MTERETSPYKHHRMKKKGPRLVVGGREYEVFLGKGRAWVREGLVGPAAAQTSLDRKLAPSDWRADRRGRDASGREFN